MVLGPLLEGRVWELQGLECWSFGNGVVEVDEVVVDTDIEAVVEVCFEYMRIDSEERLGSVVAEWKAILALFLMLTVLLAAAN